MSPTERLNALQALEDREAAQQGRPSCDITSKNMAASEYGSYCPDNNSIELNSSLLSSVSPEECLNTYFHESRHAYQQNEVTNPSPWGDPSLAKSWEENLNNYINPDEDFEGYENQPVEKDANDYAANRMTAFYANEGQAAAKSSDSGHIAGDSSDRDYFEIIAENGMW